MGDIVSKQYKKEKQGNPKPPEPKKILKGKAHARKAPKKGKWYREHG